MERYKHINNRSGRVWGGLIILAIGVLFLLKNLGLNVPDWILSWPMLLVAVGLLIGFKRNFHGGGWLVLILVGGYFTVEHITALDLSKFYLAAACIVLGLYLILKPKRRCLSREKWKRKFEDHHEKRNFKDSDVLDSVNVFGGANQTIYSKNFKGGDIVAIFGGCDLNLTQADFEGTIVLDIVAIFGGVKITIPPTWEVKSEVTAIFGGMEDKRGVAKFDDGPHKTVIIEGVVLFGGVDIRNF